MIIEPKVRGFICTAAHPIGCFKNVQEQAEYVQAQGSFQGPKNVLVIGASTGYGLASRIVAAFGANAKTIGVMFERSAAAKRTASPGWYNTAAFEQLAHAAGSYAKSINGDAFSDEIKQQTAALIRQDLGQVDLIVYSLASPRRINPRTAETFNSVLKPIGHSYTNKTIDPVSSTEIKQVSLEPASEAEIAATVQVMGGEDWQWWIELLLHEGLLAEGATTVAYSYIGPELTYPIYKNGTIGRAKDHLQSTADFLNTKLHAISGQAMISVNKALVTQASSAIPVVPLYLSILIKQMKEQGTNEGCIEQMDRLFRNYLYNPNPLPRDAEGRIRIDDLEMRPEIQKHVSDCWQKITTDNVHALADLNAYRDDFYKLFGFNVTGIDYAADVEVEVPIPSILEEVADSQ